MKKIDAHFVPRFYLSNFTDPIREPGGRRKASVWYAQIESPNEWSPRLPRDIATETDFYNGLTAEHNQENLETRLAGIEAAAAPVLRALCRLAPVDEHARRTIVDFAHLQIIRVPAFIDRFSGFFVRSLKETIERIQAQLPTGTNIESMNVTMNFLGTGDHESTDPGHELSLTGEGRHRESNAGVSFPKFPELQSMGWVLIVAQHPEYFITCDDPVSIRTRNGSPWHTSARAARDTEVILPIGRSLALKFLYGVPGARFRMAAPGEVASINCRTAASATRFLAAPSIAFPGSDWIRANWQQMLGRSIGDPVKWIAAQPDARKGFNGEPFDEKKVKAMFREWYRGIAFMLLSDQMGPREEPEPPPDHAPGSERDWAAPA